MSTAKAIALVRWTVSILRTTVQEAVVLRQFAGPLLALALAAGPAAALEVSDNVAFTGVNLSPWDSGPAIDLQNDQTLSKSFNITLPAITASPVQELSDLLGIPLPINANVAIGANTNGNVTLDFGYAVTSGNLNINYPAVGTIQIPTAPNSNVVAASQVVPLSTTFQPGLKEQYTPSVSQLSQIAGGGYAAPGTGLALTTIQAPTFSTTFPYFAAWADANYNVNAGVGISADLKVFGACIVCASKSLTIGDSDSFPIIEIDPGQVKVLGQDLGNIAGNLPIVPPDVSATITIPNLKVGSAPLAPGAATLSGSGSSPVIQLNLALDKLVPAIGAFLTNNIGPFGYSLLSADGGPNLGVYQNFSFTPTPMVDFAFSQPVLEQGTEGVYHLTKNVEFNLGASINLEIPFSTNNNVTVQPTYILNNTFSNETGITFGAALNVSGLSLNSDFGDLGPAFSTTLSADGLIHIPLYDNSFEEPLGAIAAEPFTINVGSRLGEIVTQRYQFEGVTPDGTTPQGNPQYDIRFLDTQQNAFVDFVASGQVMTFCDSNSLTPCQSCDLCKAESVLDTGGDLTLPDGTDFGEFFCISCILDTFNTTSPFITDAANNPLFLSDLTDFPSGGCESNIGLCDGTFAQVNQAFDPTDPTTTQISSESATIVITNVAEPGTVPLLVTSFAGIMLLFSFRPARTRLGLDRAAA